MMQLTFAGRWSGLLLAAFVMAGPARGEDPAKAGNQKVVQDGIAVEVSVQPVDGTPGPVREGQDARVTLKITDKLTGNPLTGLYPGGWMDRAGARKGFEKEVPADCQKKVESFIGGSMLSRPELDLNTYYVLALNQDATISVVDPLFGYGSSKLLTMVFLRSPGEERGGGEHEHVLEVSILWAWGKSPRFWAPWSTWSFPTPRFLPFTTP